MDGGERPPIERCEKKRGRKQRSKLEKQRRVLAEARLLLNQYDVPQSTVAKRLNISPWTLRKIIRDDISDPQQAFYYRMKKRPMAKMHSRTR